MRLSSLSAKIFFAFFVVLAAFGGVSAFGAFTMRRLGDEVQRVAGGYLNLRLQLQDLKTQQYNLVQTIERTDEEALRAPGQLKNAVDFARRYRKKSVREIRSMVLGLQEDARSGEERSFLNLLDQRLTAIQASFNQDEELLDQVFGPSGTKAVIAPLASLNRPLIQAARKTLMSREKELLDKDLDGLMRELRGRVQRAEGQLEAHERSAVWATVILALVVALLGLGVMWLAQRALAPLSRLAASAKLIARGDYRQRVVVDSADEIGQMASEFNAMAAALEERELRLIRSERLAAIGKIAAQITHEVRNPLSSIGLNAELLEEELGALEGAGESRKLAAAIVKEVDRLAEITEQYLRFARLPSPKLESEDLNALITSLLVFLREDMAGRGIAVETDLAGDLGAVPLDENQLRQALLNLLRNAADAMRAGGRLSISTRRSGQQIRVRISDTGDGIQPEDRGRIFDPFFTTKQGGTGLGLSLTQQIVLEHGGEIDLESEPGRGTTFTITLPAPPAGEPPAPPAAN